MWPPYRRQSRSGDKPLNDSVENLSWPTSSHDPMRIWRHCCRPEPQNGTSVKEGLSLTDPMSVDVPERSLARADIGIVCALRLEVSDFLARCDKVKTYT